ncbi:MAG: mechanosensitive ion channel domain-containing protein [Arenicellales bacterium]
MNSLAKSLQAAIAIIITSIELAVAQDLNTAADESSIAVIRQLINWPGVVTSLIIVVASWMVLRFISNIVDNLGEVFAERRLKLQKINAFFKFFIYIGVGVVVVLLSLRLSEQTLTLMGGALAFALGFAAKDLVASLVAGFMIMADRPFQVGDRVSFGGVYGDVTAIGLRSVRVRTLDDSIVTIPNNMFLTDVTTCGNYGVLHMQIDVDLHIGIDQDVKLACELYEEATATSRYIYLQNPIDVRVKQVVMNDMIAIRLRLKAYVLDTKYEKAFETDVTLRALEAFAKHGIGPPAVLHRNLNEVSFLPRTQDPA